MQRLVLTRADDLHIHLRQGALMEAVTAQVFVGGVGRCMVMPNLTPPLVDLDRCLAYRQDLAAIEPRVTFLMSLFLHPSLTPEVIAAAAEAGVSVIKSYPRGVTTNAGCGIEDYRRYDAVFAAMQEHGLILSMHGEVPSDAGRDICVLNAEEHFLVHLRDLHARFPRLRLILEHASCAASVACVRELHDTVAATITPHHLELTIDDWAGRTHHFCKPVAKYARDRAALQAVVAEGHPRFFLGSDSAPHPRSAKETAIACGGIYSSPLLLPYLATTFERLGCLDRLEAFVAGHGAGFYGLPPNAGTVMLERRPQRVPEAYGEVVPFLAGEELAWTVVDQTA